MADPRSKLKQAKPKLKESVANPPREAKAAAPAAKVAQGKVSKGK
jgi:hypothetical protein